MAKDANPGTQISPKPERRSLLTIPGWASVVLVFMLIGILAFFLWYEAERFFVTPYYEYKHLELVTLDPVVQNVQARIEYPRRISLDDRGTDHGKRIVVSVTKTMAGPAEPIYLAVKLTSGYIRFLTEDGSDTSGRLVVTATYGIADLDSVYIEHPNVSPGGAVFFDVEVLPPTGAITQPIPVQGLSFAIEGESLIGGAIRRATDFIPWETFLVTLLALPGALLKALWDRKRKITDLYERTKQAWEAWHVDEIRTLYNEYRRVRHRVSFRIPLIDILRHGEMEFLYRRAQARFHFEQTSSHFKRATGWFHLGDNTRFRVEQKEAEKHLTSALGWDPIYEKVRALDQETQKLEEEYRETKIPAVWWFEPIPDLKVRQILITLLEDKDRTQAEVRRRIVNILGHVNDEGKEAKGAIDKAFREDNDPFVRAQAAWMLAPRPWLEEAEERMLRVAMPEVVEDWLEAFPSPLDYNPFEAITAEADVLLDRHFFEHPVYRQLVACGSQHVAIFADPGGGKTSCRRMLKSSLDSPPHLVVEYTNFGALLREPRKMSIEDDVQGILRQASAPLNIALSPPGDAWQEQLRRFLEKVRSRGYTAIHVLVDNVHGYAETQADPRIANLLLRHLVGDFDLLDTDDLYFTFCLPFSLKERLLAYGGFTTGRIKIENMIWGQDLLREVIKVRLETASSSRSKVDSLMPFTARHRPMDLDNLLVEQAQDSPRRLISLVNMLFQHRAQTWYESDRSTNELYITMADYATLLEHLPRQSGVK